MDLDCGGRWRYDYIGGAPVPELTMWKIRRSIAIAVVAVFSARRAFG
jgi:hypothetical protein